jgi:uncharacterized integral membrane protein (TIGR00697 family)
LGSIPKIYVLWRKDNMNKLSTLSGVFCASLIISNILAFKTFTLFGLMLPSAVIMFPIVYIVNDMLAELYDYKTVKQIIYTGFFMNLIAVIAYSIAIKLPSSPFFTGQDAFELVLSNSLRVLIASMIAYLVGSFTNLKIMNTLKNKNKDKGLAFRCILSTVFGESADAFCFILIAFLGTMPFNQLLIMITGQALFKIVYEIVFYPITGYVIKRQSNK